MTVTSTMRYDDTLQSGDRIPVRARFFATRSPSTHRADRDVALTIHPIYRRGYSYTCTLPSEPSWTVVG